MNFCECGCGQKVKLKISRFKQGHRNKTMEGRQRLSKIWKGRCHTEETKRKISLSNSGENSPHFGLKGERSFNFGRKHSEEINKKKGLKGKKSPWYGKCHTEETKRKISQSKSKYVGWHHSEKTKRKISENTPKGKDHYLFGKQLSKETKEKISDKLSGSLNPSWKGGINAEPYCEIWLDKEYKKDIKKRDGYKCMNPFCLNNSQTLVVHHIDYDKKNCAPFNLISLCNSCNAIANFDRGFWFIFYKQIIEDQYESGEVFNTA